MRPDEQLRLDNDLRLRRHAVYQDRARAYLNRTKSVPTAMDLIRIAAMIVFWCVFVVAALNLWPSD